MQNNEAGVWTGKSGADYLYHAYPIPCAVPRRFGGFIYAKRNDEGLWVPLYVGQGDLSVCCKDPEVLACLQAKGATHIHMRINRVESDRVEEVEDLLARYSNAFEPQGCHKPRGA